MFVILKIGFISDVEYSIRDHVTLFYFIENLPKILSGPNLSPITKDGKLTFKCEFDSDTFESTARYEVTWYEGQFSRKINQTDVLKGDERVAYLQNPTDRRTNALFKLGVQVEPH